MFACPDTQLTSQSRGETRRSSPCEVLSSNLTSCAGTSPSVRSVTAKVNGSPLVYEHEYWVSGQERRGIQVSPGCGAEGGRHVVTILMSMTTFAPSDGMDDSLIVTVAVDSAYIVPESAF